MNSLKFVCFFAFCAYAHAAVDLSPSMRHARQIHTDTSTVTVITKTIYGVLSTTSQCWSASDAASVPPACGSSSFVSTSEATNTASTTADSDDSKTLIFGIGRKRRAALLEDEPMGAPEGLVAPSKPVANPVWPFVNAKSASNAKLQRQKRILDGLLNIRSVTTTTVSMDATSIGSTVTVTETVILDGATPTGGTAANACVPSGLNAC